MPENADKLAVPANTIAVLKKYDIRFRKRYGQNFLVDPSVTERIVEKSGIGKDSVVLEIGPGIGTLTQYLAEAAGHVIAVEIDRDLIPVLSDTLADYDNVTVLNGDIMDTDIRALADRYNNGRALDVVANLPYYITTPVIMRLLEGDAPIRTVTVMVQKEVAQRMQAGPGGKDYGALSLAVAYYSEARIIASVPPNCFMPRPEVASAVIRLDLTKHADLPETDRDRLFAVIRAAFGQRRKTLANCLKNAGLPGVDREMTEAVLTEMGLDTNIRGEALTLEQFARLTSGLTARGAIITWRS